MRGIEAVMLKWLTIVAVLLGFGAPLASAGTSYLEQILREYGNREASCQKMTLLKFASENADFMGKGNVLPFDTEACGKVLKPIRMSDVLKPLSLTIEKIDQTSNSKSRVVRAVRQLVEEHRQKNMVKSLHTNAQPLADTCKTVAAGRESNAGVMCYFGGPTTENGKVFKVIYQAMLDHALPDHETVCSPEPITSKTASTKTFGELLPDRASALTWKKLQTSLKSDDFQCDQDECHQNIMGILLPKGRMLEENSGANGKPPFGIILRQLAVDRGNRRAIGPSIACRVERRNNKKTDDCSRAENGVQKGICLASEDWHVWGLLLYGMNAFRSE